jgi:hypothetical protein
MTSLWTCSKESELEFDKHARAWRSINRMEKIVAARVKISDIGSYLAVFPWGVFRVVFEKKLGWQILYRKSFKTLSTHAIERKECKKKNVWFDHRFIVIVIYIRMQSLYFLQFTVFVYFKAFLLYLFIFITFHKSNRICSCWSWTL